MRPHHIGYLVDDVENAAQALERLGYRRRGEATRDDGREIFILFLENGGLTVELIKPDGRESPYYGLRKTFRNAPYHMGYAVADLGRAIDEMVNCGNPGGYMLLQPPAPAPAIPGCPNAAFLMNRFIGIVELVETPEDEERERLCTAT